ncbi:SPK domain-containing protein [Caenorhabditis elegans]|uniref:SPK domain-containing protein n=1 Tax=Caenorhabditis elegans TaxID=6239 RepID=Q23477_CAEEL|nr:SPK domain-containing protein [Caenorhabditis elegans]CCD69745.2 SPK domain-containing protein [Caenorhabditis elegans]
MTLIKSTGTVKIDKKMRICNYKSRDGKLTLERIHSKSSKAARKRSTKIMLSADDVRLMTFLVEKTKEANEPLVATKVFMEFGKKENARCSDGAYYRKFHKKLAPNMDQLDNYSIESRLRVMLGLVGEVSDDFLTQVQTEGIVVLNDGKRICEYASRDGKLKLEADHSHSARMKRTSAYHRKAGRHVHMVMNASQTTNQAESDEDGVDSATSLPRSPKRARTEMSSSDDDDDLEIIETVDGYPKPEPVDFDFEELLNRDSTYNLLIDHSQEYKEVMMEENNQPTIYVKSLQLDSDDDEVQYIGAMKGQPKPEPIFEGFAPHNSNSDHVQEEQKTGVPRFDRQQISLSANTGATSDEPINMSEFLKQLTQFICFLKSRELEELKQQIKKSIGTNVDKKILFAELRGVFEAFLITINRKIKATACPCYVGQGFPSQVQWTFFSFFFWDEKIRKKISRGGGLNSSPPPSHPPFFKRIFDISNSNDLCVLSFLRLC